MARQRNRHLQRQPIEEAVRVAMAEVVGNYGYVEVERHGYEWRADDLLVWVHAREQPGGPTYNLFRQRVAETLRTLCPAGQTFGDWLVVVQRGSETLDRITWHEKTD